MVFTCPYCKATLDQQRQTQRDHITNVHKVPFKCAQCMAEGQKLTQDKGDKNYYCNDCWAQYEQQNVGKKEKQSSTTAAAVALPAKEQQQLPLGAEGAVAACFAALQHFCHTALQQVDVPKKKMRFFTETLAKYGVLGGKLPSSPAAMRAAIRACCVSMPAAVCEALPEPVLATVDALLSEELGAAKVVAATSLPTVGPGVAVWQGDMSLLAADAVVNPANGDLLGCFSPEHRCLDNILHAQAGPRLRIACAALKRQLGIEEDVNGQCRETPAFQLPAKFVFHTVGPCLLMGRFKPPRKPTAVDQAELASCYRSCLDKCVELGLSSIAFCCISTGAFAYPNDEGAMVALRTTKQWLEECNKKKASAPFVVFNVFKDEDLALYTKLGAQFFAPAK